MVRRGRVYYCTWRLQHAMKTESRFLHTPPAFDAPVTGFPSECCHDVWCGKTRMVWPPDGGKKLKISLFVLTESTNVTYTERQTDRHRMTARTCIASRGNTSQLLNRHLAAYQSATIFCRAMLCIARLLPSPGVCPSVRLFVRHVRESRQNE